MKRTATIVARDKVLVIGIPIPEFRAALEQAKCTEVVYEHIKRRVRSNVLGVVDLFAGVPLDPFELPSSCEKHGAGEELDLSKQAYFLFNGRVEISPPGGENLTIAASGQASAETVVGIVSRAGQPDGRTARVVEEAVALSVPHEALRAIQEKSPQVQRNWDALWGVRVGSLRPRHASEAAQ